jgi:hypothetical protein
MIENDIDKLLVNTTIDLHKEYRHDFLRLCNLRGFVSLCEI